MLRPLQSSPSIHLILTSVLGDRYYYSHFTDEKTEVLSRSRFKPRQSGSRACPQLSHFTEVSEYRLYLHLTEDDSGLGG